MTHRLDGTLGPALAAAVWLCLAGCNPTEELPRSDADGFVGELDGDVDPPDGPPPDMGPPAGTEGGPCRGEAPPCDDDLRCIESRCTAAGAGGVDQPCRAMAPRCDAALLCEDDICRFDPACPDACPLGETRCVDDDDERTGYVVCGGRSHDDCTIFGEDLVECDPGRTCEGGGCVPIEGAQHARPDFALLVDRGVAPGEWPAWRRALVDWVRAVQPAIGVGAETFPGAECAAGDRVARGRFTADAIAELLARPAPAGRSRPLFEMMGHTVQILGAPNEGQFVVLLTAGDETCAEAEAFVRRVRALRGRGVRTLVLRVAGPDAPFDPVLDAAGHAGGLARPEDATGYRDLEGPSDLRAALDDLAELADPGCADGDGDRHGPFCPAGPDCADDEPAAYVGAVEQCDGIDNDCDGVADEGVAATAPDADLSVGLCVGLKRTCVDGAWIEPDYVARVPGFEQAREVSCDRLDNDCDGAADEGIGDRVGPCVSGRGVCARAGTWICDPMRAGRSVCDAVAGEPEGPEQCDGEDDDCDGVVDEDAPAGGVEVCDGRDDDCDDVIDEDADLGACAVAEGEAAYACQRGACVVACAADRRDADGAPGCEAPGFGALALGDGFTCLVDPRDGPICYGRDDAPALDPADVLEIAAGGRHACVRFGGAQEGEVACYGPDATIRAATAGRYTAIGVGDAIACGLTLAGVVECWSSTPASAGQLGAGRVSTALAVGARHVCALDAEGRTACYGACAAGCDGQGAAPANARFSALSAGAFHTCGIERGTGAARCWGAGAMPCDGPLCDQNRGQSRVPAGAGPFRAIAAGNLHTCALTTDFAIRCWGWSDGGRTAAPAGRFSAIWAGGDHTCARRFDGRIACWGVDLGGETAPLE